MRNPVESIGDRLARTTSRRGFLAALGKIALLGGAAVAALGQRRVFAYCGPADCLYQNHNYGLACPPGDQDSFVNCCLGSGGEYEIRMCQHYQFGIGYVTDCYYSFAVEPGCPNAPTR